MVHKSVEFSKRPTGADFMKAVEETSGDEPDFTLAMMVPAISTFGSLTMPVPMTTLLSLNWRDREILTKAFYEFLGNGTSGEENESKIITPDKVHLAFGVDRDGAKFTDFTFGKMLTAYDEISIRRELKRRLSGKL